MPETVFRNYWLPGVDDAADGPFAFTQFGEGVDVDMDAIYTRVGALEVKPERLVFFNGASLAPSWTSEHGGVVFKDPLSSAMQVTFTARQRLLVNTPYSITTAWSRLADGAVPATYWPTDNITVLGAIEGTAGFGVLCLRITASGELYARAMSGTVAVGQNSIVTGVLGWRVA